MSSSSNSQVYSTLTYFWARIPHPAPRLLSALLVSSDTNIQQSRFSETSYSCGICLTSIKGARCLRLACSHVFCRSCLEDFWKLCIKEGDVTRVGCPDPTCVKEAREASEEEVRRVVTEEEVQRWKWLRQKRLFEIGQSRMAHGRRHIIEWFLFHRSYYGALSCSVLSESRS